MMSRRQGSPAAVELALSPSLRLCGCMMLCARDGDFRETKSP